MTAGRVLLAAALLGGCGWTLAPPGLRAASDADGAALQDEPDAGAAVRDERDDDDAASEPPDVAAPRDAAAPTDTPAMRDGAVVSDAPPPDCGDPAASWCAYESRCDLLDTDPRNCGGCGTTCSAEQPACDAGTCVFVADAGGGD